MAKKCIPGVFCIENMTLFILLFVFLILILLLFFTIRSLNATSYKRDTSDASDTSVKSIVSSTTNSFVYPSIDLARNDVFNDPYYPPLKDNVFTPFFSGIPINIETRPTYNSTFNQVGILTTGVDVASTDSGRLILPIFGRNLSTNRDKWQYYTLSNSGNISSKLPIRVKGKDGMKEYGVDEIYDGDSVFVQGYNDNFIATVYDTRIPSYIPF